MQHQICKRFGVVTCTGRGTPWGALVGPLVIFLWIGLFYLRLTPFVLPWI